MVVMNINPEQINQFILMCKLSLPIVHVDRVNGYTTLIDLNLDPYRRIQIGQSGRVYTVNLDVGHKKIVEGIVHKLNEE